MRKSNEIEGDGFSTRGKLFYMQVHKSLKAIRSKKWKHLWTEFWKTEGEKHIKKKKKAGRVWQSVVPEADVDEFILFDSKEEEDPFGGFANNETPV